VRVCACVCAFAVDLYVKTNIIPSVGGGYVKNVNDNNILIGEWLRV
jgi:hypothetical protein